MRALRSIRQMEVQPPISTRPLMETGTMAAAEIMSTMETEPGAGRMEAPGARRRLLRQRTKAALP